MEETDIGKFLIENFDDRKEYNLLLRIPVSLKKPSIALHFVPSPLHVPHLSSMAFESNTQSQPTF